MTAARVLVVEHESTCPPARFAGWLVEGGCELDVWRPYLDETVPSLEGCHGLLVLGGSMDAVDPDIWWLAPVQELIREADRRDVATLGICLGHQLCALAFGGSVERNPRGQTVGLTPLHVTDAHDLLLGTEAGAGRRALFWNDDVVTHVPTPAVVLSRSEHGDVQAVRWTDRVRSVQWHPEIDLPVLEGWAASDADRHLERGIDQEAVLAEVRDADAALAGVERQLALRFAAEVGARAGAR